MILTAAEMMAALVGAPVEFDAPGLGTVRVRGLTMLEYERVQRLAGQGDATTLLEVLDCALMEPKLTRAELEQMTVFAAGKLRPVFERIMALSAGSAGDEAAQASFGGGGS